MSRQHAVLRESADDMAESVGTPRTGGARPASAHSHVEPEARGAAEVSNAAIPERNTVAADAKPAPERHSAVTAQAWHTACRDARAHTTALVVGNEKTKFQLGGCARDHRRHQREHA